MSDIEMQLAMALHERQNARDERDALRIERDAALALAYMGDHHFPDLSWKARAHEILAERDALKAKLGEAEKSLFYIRGLHAASAELVGADYEAYQDETPALIARMFKDAEVRRDEAVAMLREARAEIALHDGHAYCELGIVDYGRLGRIDALLAKADQ